jgi:hypothetical protein
MWQVQNGDREWQILSLELQGQIVPFVAADMAVAQRLGPLARAHADLTSNRVRLMHFVSMGEAMEEYP